jgi:hypothetical protein
MPEKYEYSFEEIVKYRRTMKVELPEDWTEQSFQSAMETAECGSMGADDVASKLERMGVKIIEQPDTSMDSPESVEIEYFDHDTLEG